MRTSSWLMLWLAPYWFPHLSCSFLSFSPGWDYTWMTCFLLKLPAEWHTMVVFSAAPSGTTATRLPGGGGEPHAMWPAWLSKWVHGRKEVSKEDKNRAPTWKKQNTGNFPHLLAALAYLGALKFLWWIKYSRTGSANSSCKIHCSVQQQLVEAVKLLGCNGPSSQDTLCAGVGWRGGFSQHPSLLLPFPSQFPSWIMGFKSPVHPGFFTATDLARTASVRKICWLKFQLQITVRLQRCLFYYGAGVDMYVCRPTKRIYSSSLWSIFSSWPRVMSVHREKNRKGGGAGDRKKKLGQ